MREQYCWDKPVIEEICARDSPWSIGRISFVKGEELLEIASDDGLVLLDGHGGPPEVLNMNANRNPILHLTVLEIH
jgi:hypothetical protein